MVIWGFEIGDRYLKFRPFCIKIILTGLQKSEITDCDTGGCGMWVPMKLKPVLPLLENRNKPNHAGKIA